MKRETRLRKLTEELTEILTDKAQNPAEYVSVLTMMLGIGIGALTRNKNDEHFEEVLKESMGIVVCAARDSRERLQQEESGEGEWVSVH